jgi:hypothetical protein
MIGARIEQGPGRLLTMIGSLIAITAAGVAARSALAVPRFRMPESSPEDVDA